MTLVTQFDTPASLRDAPLGSAFYTAWHNLLAGALDTTLGSGTGAGSKFYDASELDIAPLAEHSIVWMGFPRQVLMAHRDDKRAAFTEADGDVTGRDPQNEYCEWWVKRNGAGLITKVVIVTETPEYWRTLWDFNRSLVVNLYNSILGLTTITEADLRSGGPGSSYNPFNAFNTTNGIVHFIQGINTLGAAVGLARGSMAVGTKRDNFEMNPGPATNVDPRVAMDIGSLARKTLAITLREPIGLYIVGYDDTGWTKPNGTPVDNYWSITRGAPGRILRLEYEVPPGTGFVVGDIRIGGRRIEWGGQIAEHITVMLAGIAGSVGP